MNFTMENLIYIGTWSIATGVKVNINISFDAPNGGLMLAYRFREPSTAKVWAANFTKDNLQANMSLLDITKMTLKDAEKYFGVTAETEE